MTRLAICLLLSLALFSSAQVSAQEGTPSSEYIEYTVVRGDTLGNIAFRYGTTTRALLQANGLTNPDLIIAGTTLRIPVSGGASSSASVTSFPPVVPIPSIGYDVGGEIVSFTHLGAMRDTSLTWAKVRLRWHAGETITGARRIIERLHSEGFSVLLEISASPPLAGVNRALYFANFTAYLGEVAALAPEAIEVWGGMNAESEWAHGLTDPAAYAEFMRGAFMSIKRGNSSVLVISGALSASDANLDYLNGLAAAAIGDSADCIGIGYTVGALPPSSVSGDARGSQFIYYYPTVLAAYASVFPNKPLCLTEVGYLVPGPLALGSGYSWASTNTAELQAQWLAEALTLAQDIGRVRLFIVYNVDGVDDPAARYAIIDRNDACLACQSLGAVTSPAE
jgi:murein DD-endopeptidase MepM/ murein hydrolase activator NlpD